MSLIVICLAKEPCCNRWLNPENITWGLVWDPHNLEDSCNMDSFIDTMFEFLDQETENCDDLELKIFKLILDQETANNDETDIKISKLIQSIGQEEEELKEPGKPSKSTCAPTLMSILNQMSEKLLSSAGRNLRYGCHDIEKCLSPTDLSNEVLDRDYLELNPPSAQANETPSTAELNTASFQSYWSGQHVGPI